MTQGLTHYELRGNAASIGAATMLVSPLTVLSNPLPKEETINTKKKRILGQFFTARKSWLQPQVEEFIIVSGDKIAYDPFAGPGRLLSYVRKRIASIAAIKGLDIDTTFGWNVNDSLVNIPHEDGAIIITNPPYITNYSATRKKLVMNCKSILIQLPTTMFTSLLWTRCLRHRRMWSQ